MAVIGISGKKQSGKDTIGKMIQILIDSPHFNDEAVVKFLRRELIKPSFEIMKFADSLKDMMCILIGCTRLQLEDEEFKNTELPEEWWYYKIKGLGIVPRNYFSNQSDNEMSEKRYMVKPTPRLLMQLLGTEAGRDILHPNLWVISLFSKYKYKGKIAADGYSSREVFPHWIITDVRFPNEAKIVKEKDGLLFRVESKRCNNEDKHPSETSLDKYKEFDEVIVNDGTIEELVQKVRQLLIKYKFIDVSGK